MRYSRCEEYLNIYSENPTQVSLIIIKSLDDPEKIIGTIWTDRKNGFHVIDIVLFIEYYYKRNQTYQDDRQIMFNGSEISTEDSIIEVELKLEVVFIDIHTVIL
jgi:hypothetical protein